MGAFIAFSLLSIFLMFLITITGYWVRNPLKGDFRFLLTVSLLQNILILATIILLFINTDIYNEAKYRYEELPVLQTEKETLYKDGSSIHVYSEKVEKLYKRDKDINGFWLNNKKIVSSME